MEINSYIWVGTADSAKPKKKEVLCLILFTGRVNPHSYSLSTLVKCDVMVGFWRHHSFVGRFRTLIAHNKVINLFIINANFFEIWLVFHKKNCEITCMTIMVGDGNQSCYCIIHTFGSRHGGKCICMNVKYPLTVFAFTLEIFKWRVFAFEKKI